MMMNSTSNTNIVIAVIMAVLLASVMAVSITDYSTSSVMEYVTAEIVESAAQEPIPETNPDEALQPEDPIPEEAPDDTNPIPKTDNDLTELPRRTDGSPNPIATIEMENGGIIKVELLPVYAPNTVANFVNLASNGFYDGLTFHRVIQEFMIQGGDPLGNGMGGCGYAVFGEFNSNDFQNDLSHQRGVISMARSADPNSAGSQFFICVADASFLDGEYAAFGMVIGEEGLEVIDSIVTADTPNSLYASGVAPEDIKDADGNDMEFTDFNVDMPIHTQRIKTITVETFGEVFEAETLPEPVYEEEIPEETSEETTEETTEETEVETSED